MMTQRNSEDKWEKTKEQLTQISRKALALAKASEAQLKKLSHHGSVHFDATALHLRRERLYYLIGKEYVKNRNAIPLSVRLTKFLEELDLIEKEYYSLKSKMKTPDKNS